VPAEEPAAVDAPALDGVESDGGQDEEGFSDPWPREITGENGGKALVYQPQVIGWEEFAVLRMRVAAAVTAAGAEEPALGAIEIVGETDTDLESRLVGLSNLRVEKANFPSLDEAQIVKLQAAFDRLLPTEGLTISVDRVVANLERGKIELDRGVLNTEPPPIFISNEPAILLLFDGEPAMSSIEDTELEYAVNTNWEYFYDKKSSQFFLLVEDAWLQAPGRGGPWTPADKLPRTFKKLPKDDPNFANAREHRKAKKMLPAEVPRVFEAEVPSELILIRGEPALQRIEDTGLLWVANTESDLFLSMEEERYYYLVSGRWFRADSLDGAWTFATDKLPEDFAKIPADHPRGYVRASVPGTPDADEAVLLAQIPQKAKVERDQVTATVEYAGEPEFKPIEGSSLEYAVNTSSDVIKIGDLYFLCYQAVWFSGSTPEGPWTVTAEVPDEIYAMPPSSPVYNTTYVKVYEETPTYVTYGYTSGYWGMYWGWGCLMYGTGWYYDPYFYPYGHYPYYPIYYGYPYSYGVSAWYNPHTGTYGRGASFYAPYGGMGFGAAYTPGTGTYARGAVAHGPYNSRGFAEAYNPRTGTYARTRQGSNVYGNWGSTGVRRGDDWVRTSHLQGNDAGMRRYRTSEGGSGFVGHGQDNLYAGRDGNVYRNDGSGWQKYGGGDWSNVQRPNVADRGGAPGTRDLSGLQGIDRGTYDQLSRDRYGRDRGATRTRNYDHYQRAGGGYRGRPGGYAGVSRGGGGRRR
jgi:hypothetical protein